ncbi:hypothetical protein A2U01_0074912, partial [Trifolium medium]|nr:hypothetical protein [Trifolium medium]
MDISSDSFNSSANMSTGRSAHVESLAEIEQRLRAEQQEAIASKRDQLRPEWAAEFRG